MNEFHQFFLSINFHHQHRNSEEEKKIKTTSILKNDYDTSMNFFSSQISVPKASEKNENYNLNLNIFNENL